MIGAIIGDIAGSRFEFHNHKSKDFDLFTRRSRMTDDSMMTLAVAQAILSCSGDFSDLSQNTVRWMQTLGRKYPFAGYGGHFLKWIASDDPKPYRSYGDGAGMRVSPCGFAAGSIGEAKRLADLTTKVTHNHPEGMKGGEAIAVCVFLAKSGMSIDEIRGYVTVCYYDLDFTIDDMRPKYRFDVSCQKTVPVAIEAFLESDGFEDAIRMAVSVGGDSDTIAAMTGAIAEAYYGVPEDLRASALKYMDGTQKDILFRFEKKYQQTETG